MKFIRIAQLLLILPLMLVAIGYSLPSSSVAEGEIIVSAEPKQIFELLNNPNNHPLWAPWVYSAGNQAGLSFKTAGATQGKGAKLLWQSDGNDVGNGSTEITSSVPYKFLTGDIRSNDLLSTDQLSNDGPFNEVPRIYYKFTVYNNLSNTEAQVVFQYQSFEQGPLGRLIATVFGNPMKHETEKHTQKDRPSQRIDI